VTGLDDAELVKLVAQKNEEALGELYDRYHKLVYSIAVNIVGQQEEAEEITLDVFIRLWEKADTYRSSRAKVNTWLVRIARNRSIDILRRESIRPMKRSISWADVSPEPESNSKIAEELLDIELQKQRVRKAVTTLTADQQEVLALAYFRGYSHSEIARELDLPLGTVKTRLRSAMQKLRMMLLDEH
jgi:RNA polymerase sigma-70 factor (ECF subfamily)